MPACLPPAAPVRCRQAFGLPPPLPRLRRSPGRLGAPAAPPRGAAAPADQIHFACRALQLNMHSGLNRASKQVDLLKFLADHDCNLALLSETWLPQSSPVPQLPGWRVFHVGRASRRGGGVAILSRLDVSAELVESSPPAAEGESEAAEYVVIAARLAGLPAPLTVASVYLPEGPTTAALRAVDALLVRLSQRRGLLLIGGDFNAHHATWDHTAAPTRGSAELLEALESANLQTLNDGSPTYHTFAASDAGPFAGVSAPDLTISDAASAAEAEWCVLPGACCNSDHSPVLAR